MLAPSNDEAQAEGRASLRISLRTEAIGTNHGCSYQSASRVARFGGGQQHVVVDQRGRCGMIRALAEREPRLDPSAIVLEGATVIGRVTIGPQSSVWFGAVVRGDVEDVTIGARTNLQDRAVIHVTTDRFATRVGDEVTIGHAAVLHGCTVGDRVLIGIGAIVLDGAEIGADSMIGAGALVTPGTKVPPGHLALGSPARVKRPLEPAELEHLKRSAANYVALAARYRALGVA
jgi:carbonic anhydrase/acetyltransferase-like protein (isoleucine patch superfamily)